jgi:hypothetical protein
LPSGQPADAVAVSSFLGFDSVNWIIFLAIVLPFAVAWVIFQKYMREVRTPMRSLWKHLWPTFAAFAVLLVVAMLFFWALALESDGNTRPQIILSFFSSLAEDLVFFSLLGFMIILIQRREADRGRNFDDKIDLLFDAKRLRSGEIAYLRSRIQTVSSDCQNNDTTIDVIGFDEANGLIQIDVSRSFTVANYLTSEPAVFEFKQRVVPDNSCGNEPCLKIFPAVTTSLLPDGKGGYESHEDEILHEGGEFSADEKFEPESRRLEILPGQLREFRTRFRCWQKVVPLEGAGLKELKTAAGDHEGYRLQAKKHWDELTIRVRNSLSDRIRIAIHGQDKRVFEVHPGDQQHKAYRIENLSHESKISVLFGVLKDPVNEPSVIDTE